jgi:phage terminase large subunit-like protein
MGRAVSQARAAAELELRARRRARMVGLALLDFEPALLPKYERADHLAPIADALTRAEQELEVRCCFSAPPQHGKSDLALTAIIWLLSKHPDWLIGYCTYGQRLTNSKSRQARDMARAAGLKLREDSASVHEWRTVEGGGLVATSITGSLTGFSGIKVIFLDDPYKSRADAQSLAWRDRVDDWLSAVAETRVHPGGSIFVSHTRWDVDDQIGRLTERLNEDGSHMWEYINLPAINDNGEPLWPKYRPLPFLLKKRAANENDWWSMWMGSPRPRGAGVFRGSHYFDTLPTEYLIGKGLDCAYTKATAADASCGLVLLRVGTKHYVVDVRLDRVELDEFVPQLREQTKVWPGQYRFSTSSTEKGIAQFSRLLPDSDIRITAHRAQVDKFTRAQPAAARWNAGEILVPGPVACKQLQDMGLDTSWVPRFVRTMNRFSGISDRQDDEVDGLINAFDQLPRIDPGEKPDPKDYAFAAGTSAFNRKVGMPGQR